MAIRGCMKRIQHIWVTIDFVWICHQNFTEALEELRPVLTHRSLAAERSQVASLEYMVQIGAISREFTAHNPEFQTPESKMLSQTLRSIQRCEYKTRF